MGGQMGIGVPNATGFWGRKEGKISLVILAVVAGLAAIYGWGTVVPWLLVTAADTLKLMYLMIGIVVTGVVAWQVGPFMSLLFKYTMTKVIGWCIPIYADEIAENHIVEMKERKGKFDIQVGQVGGIIESLNDTVEKNKKDAQNDLAMASEAKRQAAAAREPLAVQKMSLQMRLKSDAAQRLIDANENYGVLLAKLNPVHLRLQQYSVNMDYLISDTEDQVTQARKQHNAVDAAYNAFSGALAVLNGNTTEDQLFARDMDYLITDSSTKLGLIKNMERMTQNVMDGIDLKNGAIDTKGLAALDAYEKNALASGDRSSVMLLTGSTAAPAPADPIDAEYKDLFKK